MIYSLYSIARPAISVPDGGAAAHVGVGVANGMIGGLTGLGGIAVTIWGQLRGGLKGCTTRDLPAGDVRDVLHDRDLARLRGGVHRRNDEALRAARCPLSWSGIGCGIWLYGKLDDAAFRRVILILLLASGVSLVGPALLR